MSGKKKVNNKKPKNQNNLPKPSIEQVEHYLSKWESLDDYRDQEKAIEKLFVDTFPKNTDILEVLIKSSTLNDFYSTNIFKIYFVAKHIIEIKNIDKRLKNGDLNLVHDIQDVRKLNRKFYSFATKYCSHHNPNTFPIYDRLVDKVLKYYRRTDRFYKFRNSELRDYPQFKQILEKFREFYNLDTYNLKELDRYMWLLGKVNTLSQSGQRAGTNPTSELSENSAQP